MPSTIKEFKATMKTYKVSLKNNPKVAIEFKSANDEKAQKSALRQMSKAGYMPERKINYNYGTVGWVSCDDKFERTVVYGNSRSDSFGAMTTIELILEKIEIANDNDNNSKGASEVPSTTKEFKMSNHEQNELRQAGNKPNIIGTKAYLEMDLDIAKAQIKQEVKALIGTPVILKGYKGEIVESCVTETLIIDTDDLLINTRFDVQVEDATGTTYILNYKELETMLNEMNFKPEPPVGSEEPIIENQDFMNWDEIEVAYPIGTMLNTEINSKPRTLIVTGYTSSMFGKCETDMALTTNEHITGEKHFVETTTVLEVISKPKGNNTQPPKGLEIESNWINLEVKSIKAIEVVKSENLTFVTTKESEKLATERSIKEGAYYYALIEPNDYDTVAYQGFIIKVSRNKGDRIKWAANIAEAQRNQNLKVLADNGYSIRKNTEAPAEEGMFWITTPQSELGNGQLGPYISEQEAVIKALKKIAENKAKEAEATKMKEAEATKMKGSKPAKVKKTKTKKPRLTNTNVMRTNGEIVGNLEELVNKVLETKRANPKTSWVKLINELGLLRQDGYKVRRSCYFQSLLTDDEQNWILKAAKSAQ